MRKILLALALLTAPLPALAEVFNPYSFRLENGLEIVLVENHRAPVISHMVWYRVGAADEQAGQSGLAHYLEHLMFKGSTHFPDGQFSRLVARHGGNDNAFTSWDYTAYFQNIASDQLPLVMRMEADRMARLNFNDAVALTERAVILAERGQVIDSNPDAIMAEAIHAALFANHPYGRPIIGWRHEMEQLTPAKARDFYRRYYCPSNAVVVVAGNITPAELRRIAKQSYGKLPRRLSLPPRQRPQEPSLNAASRIERRDERVHVPVWQRVWLAPSYGSVPADSRQIEALQLFIDAVAGGMSAELYQELVVRQKLASAVGIGYFPFALDQTSISLSASPLAGISPERLEQAALELIQRRAQQGITQAELDKSRRKILAEAIYAHDSLGWPTRLLGMTRALDLPITVVEEWPARLKAVQLAEVNAVARQIFTNPRHVTGLLLPAQDTPAPAAINTMPAAVDRATEYN